MGAPLPPGYSPPFQVVDDLHRGAWVIIATALGLVVSVVCFLIRLYVRLALNPPFAADDFVLLGATIVAVAQSALLLVAVSRGFGTSFDLLTSDQRDLVQILILISGVLFLVTIYISKACVVGIHLRLTPQKLHNRISWATLALCTAWVITSVLIVAVNCQLNRPWKGTGGQCPNWLQRWQFIVAMDILTELILFGLAVALLAGLFMPLKRKLAIGSAFLFRLPIILFSILHINALSHNLDAADPTLAAVTPVIWAQIEMNYSLVACSVFCLRPFMAAVSTNYGTAGDSNLESSCASRQTKNHSASKSGSGSGSGSGLGSGSRSGDRAVEVPEDAKRAWRFLPCEKMRRGRGGERDIEDIELVERDGENIEAGGDEGQRKMVIRKDVQYSVEFNGNRSGEGSRNDTEYWDRYLDQRP